MKNLSYSENYGKTVVSDTVEVEVPKDDRTVISISNGDVSKFLAENGKPLVFANVDAAEEYAKDHSLEDYEVEPIVDYDFSGIELIEL